MTSLVSIGLHAARPPEASDLAALRALGFLSLSDLEHELAPELRDMTSKTNPKAEWFVAVDPKGEPDLDIIYELATEPPGRFRQAMSVLGNLPDIVSVDLFIYDLGTHKLAEYPDLHLKDLDQTLSDWYALGGPLGSVYHRFCA